MKYRCSKKDIRSKAIGIGTSFDVPYEIKNMCDVPNYGIFFIAGAAIGLLHPNGKMQYPIIGHPDVHAFVDGNGVRARLQYPSDICYSHHTKLCYVTELQGRSIRSLDPFDKYLGSMFKTGTNRKNIEKAFGKLPMEYAEAPICVDEHGAIFWASSVAHTCWEYSFSTLKSIAGTGQAGYSVCSDKRRSMISSPKGIAASNGDVYLSDTGNQCVRALTGSGISVLLGAPQISEKRINSKSHHTHILYNPTTLVYSKSMIYVVDEEMVKHCHSSSGRSMKNLEQNGNVSTICGDTHGGVIHMVKEDAEEETGDTN